MIQGISTMIIFAETNKRETALINLFKEAVDSQQFCKCTSEITTVERWVTYIKTWDSKL